MINFLASRCRCSGNSEHREAYPSGTAHSPLHLQYSEPRPYQYLIPVVHFLRVEVMCWSDVEVMCWSDLAMICWSEVEVMCWSDLIWQWCAHLSFIWNELPPHIVNKRIMWRQTLSGNTIEYQYDVDSDIINFIQFVWIKIKIYFYLYFCSLNCLVLSLKIVEEILVKNVCLAWLF